MGQSIVQLVDQLPSDNITVKVLKAIDYIAPTQWNNWVGFDQTIQKLTGETEPQIIQRIRERAVALYHDPKFGYESAVQLYQAIDKADAAMATAALANKVGEKISFLSFLNNITPKADVIQTVDFVLKLAVEIIAFCKLNGIPQPNPQAFVTSLSNNYQDAAMLRMVALVCLDGILPLGPNFLGKIHSIITGADTSAITQNLVFAKVSNYLPGQNPSDKLGFINQGFDAVQGWANSLVTKTGITPQSISDSLGNFIQIADDNVDFVAAFLDQTTNYYEHTGIQSVARHLILNAYESVKAEQPQVAPVSPSSGGSSVSSDSTTMEYAVGQTIEAWYEEEGTWYQGTVMKVRENEYYIRYTGYGSSDDEWLDAEDVRAGDYGDIDDNGHAVGKKVKVWDEDEEEWYTAIIQEIRGNQYYIHYLGYDSSYDEWMDADEIS